MKIELREDKHLCIQYNPGQGDFRQIIVDEEKADIRICDGSNVIKIRFNPNNKKLRDVLVNDVFVHTFPNPNLGQRIK